MTNRLSTPELQLDRVEPREQTRQELKEQHWERVSDGHELTVTTTVLDNEGDTLEATFSCEECRVSVTEVYTIRYIERVDSGERFEANSTPSCDCDGAQENGAFFQELRRTKPSSGTAVAEARCGWCGAKYRDVFKYQLIR